MIVGFGTTETNLEQKIGNELIDFSRKEFKRLGLELFDDEFIKLMKEHAEKIAKESREAAGKYKSADTFPDRYSSFYVDVVGDIHDLVFILKFSHINRRHAFSPDGWAMLQSKALFSIDSFEARKS